MFAWGSQWGAWISDLHIVQMNQSLQMTVLQHNRPLLFSFARGSWCVWRAERSPPFPPSCFLSLILLHQWGNVWPCRAKQQLWSQSVQGSFWHRHPQGWFLRWIRHPKETFQAPACTKASSSFFIVLLSPANVEGNGSVFAPRKLFCSAKLSHGLTLKFQRLLVFQTWIAWVSRNHSYSLLIKYKQWKWINGYISHAFISVAFVQCYGKD